ncbi:MAG: hypothetical protein KF718_18020 [Polyangiaceae bacterium]|nr:hypothetical protein [Polyangiaceae bacterium]
MKRRLALQLGALGVLGCASASVGPPPPAPALGPPASAIPADLDLVVRLDLGKIRAALGQAALDELRAQSRRGGLEPELERMLGDLLQSSDVVLAAVRPEGTLAVLDNVLVFRGRFATFDPQSYALTPRFGPPHDLGADVRRQQRAGATKRAEPARLYRSGDDVVVLVSSAAIDSVERQIEERQGDPHLEPPAKGVLALAARAPALGRWVDDRSVRLTRLLRAAGELSGYLDLDSERLTAELELSVQDETEAIELARALGELATAVTRGGGELTAPLRRLSVEAVGQRVVLRLVLPTEMLAAALHRQRAEPETMP